MESRSLVADDYAEKVYVGSLAILPSPKLISGKTDAAHPKTNPREPA
jgi:hypothetical protein